MVWGEAGNHRDESEIYPHVNPIQTTTSPHFITLKSLMAGWSGFVHKLCHTPPNGIGWLCGTFSRVTVLSHQTIRINYSILFTLLSSSWFSVTISAYDDNDKAKLSVSSVMSEKASNTYET